MIEASNVYQVQYTQGVNEPQELPSINISSSLKPGYSGLRVAGDSSGPTTYCKNPSTELGGRVKRSSFATQHSSKSCLTSDTLLSKNRHPN